MTNRYIYDLYEVKDRFARRNVCNETFVGQIFS